MNSLSWFIYFAGVLGNFRVVLVLVAFACVVTLIVRSVATAAHNDCRAEENKKPYPPTLRYLVPAAAFLTVAAALPSSSTVYAIAASQVGEKIVRTEAVRGMADDATKALQQWIKRQIEPDEKK